MKATQGALLDGCADIWKERMAVMPKLLQQARVGEAPERYVGERRMQWGPRATMQQIQEQVWQQTRMRVEHLRTLPIKAPLGKQSRYDRSRDVQERQWYQWELELLDVGSMATDDITGCRSSGVT